MINCQWQKPQLCQTAAELHDGHLKALHSSVSVCLSAKCVLCLFSTQPPVLLSANAYCLIIAMCVSNCLVCSCDAPNNFNQALNNGALECIQPSMSAYHICPFTTRVCAEYKSEVLHYLEGEQGEKPGMREDTIKLSSRLWPCVISKPVVCFIFKEKLLTGYYDTVFAFCGPGLFMIYQLRVENTDLKIQLMQLVPQLKCLQWTYSICKVKTPSYWMWLQNVHWQRIVFGIYNMSLKIWTAQVKERRRKGGAH